MFKTGMAGMMKKAQQMQDNIQQAQAQIKLLSATGTAAGGAINITLNGEHLVTHLDIDEALLNDKDLLEDLILTAMNHASKQISDLSAAKMKDASAGISLPGGMNLPF